MNKQYVEKVFSTERVRKYFDAYSHDQAKAITHYQCNVQISEALYPCLSVMEVALCNAVNEQLSRMFSTAHWYTLLALTPVRSGKLIL
ncbi:hypothetical protein K3G39_19100 [Pontibacter sp. HSC-14F20]|uniref:hypothetical protein n=1 Tax=Pontibacter sp. HSC-14F20 TaxID=2864136 RepID=UPI001C72D165|nr:hypothetical protein [Pontibacter sp. HSC-14F20]MBX0335348.1 hypothetical protein [Pontibacter sp. HSC-14F20]